MDIEKYIENMKIIQKSLLEYIENENDAENQFNNLIKFIEVQKIPEIRSEFKTFLYLLSKISKNHHRCPNFMHKITQILKIFLNKIKQTFSNSDIFNIFHNNLRILLFLLDEKIIYIDSSIAVTLKYPRYFYPEIKPFNDLLTFKLSSKNFSENYEEKRKIGENDKYLNQLIRDDLINEFIEYVNKSSMKLHSQIKMSAFETNNFLLKNTPTLIEYAAFFGSIKIFKYLYLNGVELSPSLWLYAIHSNNAELIHILEDNQVQPEDKTYERCFKEAIKCHHNELANYIQNNLLDPKIEFTNISNSYNIFSYYFHYYNFEYFPNDFNHKLIFLYACQFDYLLIVEFFMNNNDYDNIYITNQGCEIKPKFFSKCTKLKRINVPSFIVSIGEYAFSECTSLIQISIPPSVVSICPYVFNSCISLVNIEIPSSVTKIEAYTFNKCISLANVSLPSSITLIDQHAFDGCCSLEKINLPSSLVEIGQYAFLECSLLKEIAIPSSLCSVGLGVFASCTSMKRITLPSQLKHLISTLGVSSEIEIIEI